MQIDSVQLAFGVSMAGIIGFGAAWFIARARSSRRLAVAGVECNARIATLDTELNREVALGEALKAQIEEHRRQVADLQAELLTATAERAQASGQLQQLTILQDRLDRNDDQIAGLNATIAQLKEERARLETGLQTEQQAAAEKIALLQNLRTSISENSRVLAAGALQENNRIFLEMARNTLGKYWEGAQKDLDLRAHSVGSMVAPLNEALQRYDSQVQSMEREREKAYGALHQQLQSLGQSQLSLQKETVKLTTALRVPHVRGRWGETTLRRAAELAGMTRCCDFFEQPTTRSPDGPRRPDMVVHLPGGRRIVVDAKVPLAAYLDALEARDEDQRRQMLAAHARQLRTHMNQLAQKSYWDQLKPSPEFVIMFIPGENFFSAALVEEPGLIEAGADRGVILATPTTLIALLKTVALGWRQETAAQNSRAIGELGRELYSRLSTMVKSLNQLGQNLDRCVVAYNRTLGSFERRVLSSARKFETLGLTPEKEHPDLETRSVSAQTKTLEIDTSNETRS